MKHLRAIRELSTVAILNLYVDVDGCLFFVIEGSISLQSEQVPFDHKR